MVVFDCFGEVEDCGLFGLCDVVVVKEVVGYVGVFLWGFVGVVGFVGFVGVVRLSVLVKS